MGYPWGPENWPTISRLEACADTLENMFWTEYERLLTEREHALGQAQRNRPITINLTVQNDMSAERVRQVAQDAVTAVLDETDGEMSVSEEEQTDLLGMAFARALRSVGDLTPEQGLERCMQDLFSVLHYKVISKADDHGDSMRTDGGEGRPVVSQE